MSKDFKLTKNLSENIENLKNKVFDKNGTIHYRKIINIESNFECYVIFNEGMINGDVINENVIKSLIYERNLSQDNFLEELAYSKIVAKSIKIETSEKEMIDSVLRGDSLVLFEGQIKALVIDTKEYSGRSIIEPQAESVIRGPREGFTEILIGNLEQIRRRINNPELKFEMMKMGRRSGTKIAICYVDDLVNDKILNELKKRMKKIDVDYVLSTAKIMEFIEDHPKSPFRTTGFTERPDVVCEKILDGKVAILCDGTPVAITIPYLFHECFESNEDNYSHYIYSSVNRVLRYLAFFIGCSTPALYVAACTFHRELIPTQLAMSIYLSRVGVPFPTFFECLAMLLVFEILREASVRLPKHVGSAISIVGALVLGDAAVKAKFVSAPMVIVIALTEISALVLSNMQEALIFLRFLFLISSSVLGLYGYIFSVMGVFIHLMAMKSFGINYMLYMGNLKMEDIFRTIFRAPWWRLRKRTKQIAKDSIKTSNDENLGDNNDDEEEN
ncbi:spore germination protein [Oceanirhabdus sp. W0125-5]|uniref:spore germination protein n=1 Tax=Oceanirhabdus sp. W0125-5 TaxID=2999116 RepID=UPI0022F2A90D|nr:spore germination protein [Oceanirhabdus sp. W0125-5]WBW99419.1 spore germination protein [Oceanirhabdus sp. W0125-5]